MVEVNGTISSLYRIPSYLAKYLLWRPLGKLIFNHPFAFEDMPFLQALSMLGSTLSFTHSRMFFPLTHVYNWEHVCEKQERTIHFGVIGGTAQSAGMFMISQKKHPRAELKAIGSRTWESGEACTQKYSLSRVTVYSPYEHLLADPTIEGIVVYTPISTHEKLIERILDAGKHCFLVPPITANAAQLKRIWQYQREHHPKLMCVSSYSALSHPSNHKMRGMVRSGAIGDVQHIVIHANWPGHLFGPNSIQFNYDTAGGAWEDLGPHAITIARFMLDDTRFCDSTQLFEVKSATATLPPFASDVDETLNTTLLYGDVHVDIEVSLVKSMDISIKIEGTEGTLQQTQWWRPDMFNKLTYCKADGTTTFLEHQGEGTEYGKVAWEYMLDYLVDSVLTKEAPILMSCEEELCTLEIVDEVYRKCGLGVRCPTVNGF